MQNILHTNLSHNSAQESQYHTTSSQLSSNNNIQKSDFNSNKQSSNRTNNNQALLQNQQQQQHYNNTTSSDRNNQSQTRTHSQTDGNNNNGSDGVNSNHPQQQQSQQQSQSHITSDHSYADGSSSGTPTTSVSSNLKLTAQLPEAVEARVLLENSHVGSIIGIGGNNLKRVRDSSGAAVSILKTDGRIERVQHRVMTVRGLQAQVSTAISQVSVLIHDAITRLKSRYDSSDGISNGHSTSIDIKDSELDDGNITASVRLLVHKQAAGAIIGQQGVTIQNTQRATQCRIKISSECMVGSTDKTVELSGKVSAIKSAADIILSQLRNSVIKPGTRSLPYRPHSSMHYGLPNQLLSGISGSGAPSQYYGSSSGMDSHNRVDSGTNMATQQIAIPSSSAGIVIGKAGSTISDIRRQCNVGISISDIRPDSPDERIITLTGSPEAIQAGVTLIRKLVSRNTSNVTIIQ